MRGPRTRSSPDIYSCIGSFLQKRTVAVCAIIAIFTAIVPFARAFFRLEVSYNEGWNIYNAAALVNHRPLYPAKYSWTSVNYPILSFEIFAQLHRLTHEYLLTARIVSLLSLLACSLLVAAIVKTLKASWLSSALSGLFCFAVFCSAADIYVGMDDPQMLAQVFFLLGLLIYLRNRTNKLSIALAALFFVIASFIKHNPIDFPLAVFIDLLLISIPQATWFAACSTVLAAVAVLLNIRFGGPFFLSQLLAPRSYSTAHVAGQLVGIIGPLLLPFCVAAYTAFALRKNPTRRIATILILTTLVVDSTFGGGKGVTINAFFPSLLAISILVGLFVDQIASREGQWTRSPKLAFAPLVLFVWLIIPMILSGNWLTIRALRQDATAQANFNQDIAFLENHPGPALCESLLECNLANKPYLYDPFNATRLIHFRKLDPNILVDQIQHHRYSAIQLDDPIPLEDQYDSERWASPIRAAIQANYVLAIQHTQQRDEAVAIYIPKQPTEEIAEATPPANQLSSRTCCTPPSSHPETITSSNEPSISHATPQPSHRQIPPSAASSPAATSSSLKARTSTTRATTQRSQHSSKPPLSATTSTAQPHTSPSSPAPTTAAPAPARMH